MKKLSTLLIIAFLFVSQAYSQVNYTMSSTTGALYTRLSGATAFTWTVTTAGDEEYSNATNIGFNFTYCGTVFTQFQASTNGFIRFGTGLASASSADALNGVLRSVAAPLWDNLKVLATATDITYLLQGTPGSQTLTIEWSGVYWNNAAAAPNANFHVVLHESNNQIDFGYGLMGTIASGSASIGLADNTVITTAGSATGKFLSLNVGGSTGSHTFHQSMGYTFNGIVTAPDSGTVLSFIPATPTPFSGTFGIGAGQTYTTLSQAAMALNINGINGPVVLNIVSATYDDVFHLISVSGTSATNTITLQKGSGAVTLSPSNGSQSTSAPGASAGDAMIRLDGADFVTVDGLAFTQNALNTNAAKKFNMGISVNNSVLNSTPQSGAQFNTFKNLNMDLGGGALTAGLVGIRLGTAGTAPTPPLETAFALTNSMNTIQDVTITGFHANAIKMFGYSGAVPDSGNVITAVLGRNTIGSITGGIGSDMRCIELDCESTVTIEKTDISSVSNTVNTTNAIYGIVSNLAGSASSINRGKFIYRNNTITGLSNGGVAVTTGIAGGMSLGACNNTTVYEIYNNKISNIYSASTTTGRSSGILINGSTVVGLVAKVYNNMISDLRAPTCTSGPAVRGLDMQNGGGNGVFSVYNNTVSFDDATPPTATNHQSACMYLANFGSGTMDLRGNIFSNLMSTNGTGRAVGLYASANSNLLRLATTTDYNLYYIGTGSATRGVSTDVANIYQTLATHQTAVLAGGLGGPRDVHAKSALVNFTSSSDLHLFGASIGDNTLAGAPIALYTTDIDGATRDLVFPYIGADESSTPLYSVTPRPVPMSSAFNNSTAFGSKGLSGTDGSALFYSHWDATYLYLGWSGGRTNYSSDMYYAAIDTDPDGIAGTNNAIEGVSFITGGPKPDYYVVYENNASFYGAPVTDGNSLEIYNVSGGNWNFLSRTAGNDNTISKVDFLDASGEVRLKIPWATLGFTPASGTKLGIVMWNNNSSGNYMWGRAPLTNPANGSTPIVLNMQYVYANTGNGINPSTDKTEVALPVELTSFTSKITGTVASLNWSTATEKNTAVFEVERNFNNSTFAKVGTVKANGNSNSPKQYSFTDKNLTSGKYQYRLKIVDNDGKFEYSSLSSVEVLIPKEFSLSQNYPNPFNPTTKINYSLAVDSKVQLLVYNILGEVVTSLVNGNQPAGYYSVDFNASNLSSGTYFYKIIANDYVKISKMLLIK